MATVPFSLVGTLNMPGGPGLPNDPIAATISAAFNSQAEFKLELADPGEEGDTQDVNLGTIGSPGAKCLFIAYEAAAGAAPVQVLVNDSEVGIEIATGGFLLVGSPVPVSGITSLSIVYTSAATVRVWALG